MPDGDDDEDEDAQGETTASPHDSQIVKREQIIAMSAKDASNPIWGASDMAMGQENFYPDAMMGKVVNNDLISGQHQVVRIDPQSGKRQTTTTIFENQSQNPFGYDH